MANSIEDVQLWMEKVGFGDYYKAFEEAEIDGEALQCLTERALELLIPRMGPRMKFIKILEALKHPVQQVEDSPPEFIAPTCSVHEATCPDNPEANKSRPCKRSKHSIDAKRRQRLNRNQRKKKARREANNANAANLEKLKEESLALRNSIDVEKSIKEKYYELWRKSESEKGKLRTSKSVLSGKHFLASEKPKEILEVDPAFLENVEVDKLLGKGRFGTVVLKKFRSSLVAVKYFDSSTSANMVRKEASYMQQCCHINLPVLYGINTKKEPHFIITQFYGIKDSISATLGDVIKRRTEFQFSELEQWLYVISQLIEALYHLHQKKILHNDIKCDNILITQNCGFYSPILIDFGKACLISEAKIKQLTKEEKARYRREHHHISPEVVDGLLPPTIKSDVYSLGVAIANCYHSNKFKPLKEIAKRCLNAFPTRCSSEQLMKIVDSFRQ